MQRNFERVVEGAGAVFQVYLGDRYLLWSYSKSYIFAKHPGDQPPL